MHEHISGFDLINMFRPTREHEQKLRVTFGRVYDPKLGRFLSPDPILQDAGNTQNMNRYSYVWNNPLKYTDPSGYKNQAAVATDNGGEPGEGSYSGNWYGTGGGGTMSWNLGTIYNFDGSLNIAGPTFYEANVLGPTGNWVSLVSLQKDVKGTFNSQGVKTIQHYLNAGFDINFRNNGTASYALAIDEGVTLGSAVGITWDSGFSNFGLINGLNKGNNIDEGWVLGPISIGISFELAYPEITIGDRKFLGDGFGVSLGFVADNQGLGFYYTEKRVVGDAISLSVAPEVFYVHGTDGHNANIFSLQGQGYSTSIGLGAYGFELRVDNNCDVGLPSNYYQFTISGFAKGIDVGYGNWKTNTYITPIVY